MCDTKAHLCGEMCGLSESCKARCTEVSVDHSDLTAHVRQARDHNDEEHRCSARTHPCTHVCDFDDHQGYKCSARCSKSMFVLWQFSLVERKQLLTICSDEEHDRHECKDLNVCPLQCSLCARPCVTRDHFHDSIVGAIHLCEYVRPFSRRKITIADTP